ncbi:MAG: hypothetical protein K9M03_01605 [Kiritimatiellales bacterium]|nr:hypothetical protein [Kiritimatiellales bacterium]
MFKLILSSTITIFCIAITTPAEAASLFGNVPQINRKNIFGRVPKLEDYWPRGSSYEPIKTTQPGIFGRVPKLEEYWPRASAR